MKVIDKLILKDVCAWPNLIRLDDKTIGAVLFNRPSHGLEEGSLEFWRCDNSSFHWQYLSTPSPNIAGQNRMHCACGVDPQGNIHVLSTGFTIADNSFIKLEPMWHSLSFDGGKSWKIAKDIHVEGIEPHFIPHGSITCDENRLFATVYRSYGKGEPSKTWFIESQDGGASWSMHSQIGSGDTNEAFVLRHNNLRFAAVRTHIDHHTRLYTYLPDEKGWRDCGALTLPMQHPGHLAAAGEKGILLTYGIRNKGLMAIGGRFSADYGTNWNPPFIIHQFPNEATDCGYPSTLLINEDQVITAFYTNVSKEYEGYQFGVLYWQLSDFLSPTELESISDGKKMRIV